MTRLLEHLEQLREERRAPSGPTPGRRDAVRPTTDGFRDCRGVWHAWQEDH
ncbi:MAG: hypothetical protein ACPF9W_09445 [Nocardioides sp.]